MKKLIVLIVLIGMFTLLMGARKALVVGNNDYGENALRNAVADARDIANVLESVGFEVTLKLNANRMEFERAVQNFQVAIRPIDEVLFYYSGHGAQFEGVNYLIPIQETILEDVDLKFKAVNANHISEFMQKANVSILLLDACRDNPYRNVRSGSRGLATMEASAGSQYIIFSTSSGSTADDGKGRNSPFTSALLKYIPEPGLEISSLVKNVTREVSTATKNKQRPAISGNIMDDYYFVQAPEGNKEEKPVEVAAVKPTERPATTYPPPPVEKPVATPPAKPETKPVEKPAAKPVSTPVPAPKPIPPTPQPPAPLPEASISWNGKQIKSDYLKITDSQTGKEAQLNPDGTAKLSPGSYTLAYHQWGYQEVNQSFTLAANERRVINFSPQAINPQLMKDFNRAKTQRNLSLSSSILTLGATVAFKILGDADYKRYKDSNDIDDILAYKKSSRNYQSMFYASLSTHLISDVWLFYSQRSRNAQAQKVRAAMTTPISGQ